MSGKDGLARRKPVEQVDASLDQPINVEAPPTIYGSAITPGLATASLNLSVDFIKQQQSLANRGMIHHYITKAVLVVVASIYLGRTITLPRNLSSGSVAEFAYQFMLFNRYPLGTSIALLALTFLCLLTVYSRVTETFFKSKISEATADSGKSCFGMNLREYILKPEKGPRDAQADNTYVIVYRETPIAVISLSENKSLSSEDSLVMGISALGCRKVYLTSGILEDLLDWAMIRTRAIAKNGKYGESMKILLNVYSFDDHTKKTLKAKGFSLVASSKIKESRVLGGLFGFEKELWGVQFHIEASEKE
ncbi:hypothetical protein HG536_0F01230 [Torulaspora globosa]|uniref:Inorganic phosphate transporter PHO86 n=1 Tax=Torulaspora globosa TaxID=48254 RepID=A0A7G3ZJW2_9SACH|nr:uncharacterized protein HG536_0F01230 [Torulaspora globosa]QLL33798.1 hypothetical protein HG536_0F01230 [Torulaspora globosa]